MIASLVLSFTDFDLVHPESWKFVGLDNYIRMTTDPNVATSVRVTFKFAAITDPADDARQPRLRRPAQQPAAVRPEHLPDALLHADPDPARREHARLDRLPQPRDRLAERDPRASSGSTRARTGSTARPGSIPALSLIGLWGDRQLHADQHRRPPVGPDRAVRGGADRRRRAVDARSGGSRSR